LAKDADSVYEIAAKLDIPVNIHTGEGVPFSLPSLCVPVAQRYPELRIVVAHSGAGIFAGEAVVAATLCDNLYFDTTWCGVEFVPGILKAASSKRVLYASDSTRNISVEVEKYRQFDLSDEELKDIYYQNAESVFKLQRI
jgi:predicted TIM-barrel fold metal-dependent hydrolase